jgi:LuxR family maltose regulon positive regulatory protein
VTTRYETTVDPAPSTDLELDHRSMLDTIERIWPQIAPLQGARLREAVRSVPEREWSQRARILLALATSHRSVGSTSRSAALPWFRAVDKSIRADPETPLDVRVGYLVHLAATLRTLGNLETARTHLERARGLLEEDQSFEISTRVDQSASFSLQLGLVRIHLGLWDEASFALSLAEGLAAEHLSSAERVECHSALAFVAFQLGDFDRAEEQADRAVRHAEGTELLASSFSALTHITRFLLLVERQSGSPDYDRQLRSLRISTRDTDWEAQAVLAEALGRHTAGSPIEALDLLGRVTRLVRNYTGDPVVATSASILRAEALRSLGALDEARETVRTLVPGQHHVTCPGRIEALTAFTADDPRGALDALRECLALGELHSTRHMAPIFALVAAAQSQLANPVASGIAFDRSLLLAANTGTSWPFRAFPREVVDGLVAGALERTQPAAVVRLLQRLDGASPQESPTLAEPLSDRELVIVRHLATGATLSQIGTELFISVNTVKSHVRSIYRKLSATNRREAIARAVELGLADAP